MSRRATGLLLVLFLTLGVTGVMAAPAYAGSASFDDLLPGQEVSTQYSAQGLTFITTTPWYDPANPATADGQTAVLPRVRADDQAFSLPNVGDISGCAGEFCASRAQAWGKFDVPQTDVAVHVGDFGTSGETINLTLSSYDRDGVLLDARSQVVSGGAGYGTVLLNHSDADAIAYFRVRAESTGHDHVALDQVEFTRAVTAPPAVPGFALAHSGENIFSLGGLAPGTSRTTPLIVYRYGGSTGAIKFDFPGLPAGLEASVDPNPANPPDGGTVTLRIAAKPDATPALGLPVTVRASAVDPTATGTSTPTVTIPVNVLAKARLHVSGIEVTQGVQQDLNNPPGTGGTITEDGGLPEPSSVGAPTRYAGVKLVAARKTLVRVFVNTGPGGPKLTDTTVSLSGTGADGRPLPGSPLLPEYSPPAVTFGTTFTTMAERVDPARPFVFTLPASWTHKVISLRADTSLSGLLAGATQGVVAGGGAFRLSGIGFVETGGWEISPYVGKINGLTTPSPFAIYAASRAAMPFADGHLILPTPTKVTTICPPVTSSIAPECRYVVDPTSVPYLGEINLNDIVDCSYSGSFYAHGCDDRSDATDDALNRLIAHEEDNYAVGDTSVLVVPGPTPNFGGVTAVDEDTAQKEEYRMMVTTPLQLARSGPIPRGLSSVAHELGHSMGLEHAGQGCPNTGPNDEQMGVAWPPDDMGLIQGIGIDPRPGSGGVAGPYKIFAQDRPKFGQRWYDLMSYCGGANDTAKWISTRYWNELVDFLAAREPHFAQTDARGLATAQSAAGPARLDVRATVLSDGTVRIEPLMPATGRRAAPDSQATSRFHAVGRDRAGRMLFDQVMDDDSSHVDGGRQVLGAKTIVREAGLARIEITLDGKVLATRTRSPHPPSVEVLAPRRGQRVGRERMIIVRWRARGVPGRPLLVYVDYSADDGRTYRNVYIGPNRDRIDLPRSFFTGSRRARVRIRASDGFDQTAALSARFSAAGSPPGVVIDTPGARQRFRSDAALYLSGEGYDDAFRVLRGRALRWFDGSRPIGYGNQVALQGPRAGVHSLRLVVRDRAGRTSSAVVAVSVAAARARFLALLSPKRVSAHATALRIRVAATAPAVLRFGGERFAVDRRTRTVTLRIRPGRRALTLPLVLVSGPYRTPVTIGVER